MKATVPAPASAAPWAAALKMSRVIVRWSNVMTSAMPASASPWRISRPLIVDLMCRSATSNSNAKDSVSAVFTGLVPKTNGAPISRAATASGVGSEVGAVAADGGAEPIVAPSGAGTDAVGLEVTRGPLPQPATIRTAATAPTSRRGIRRFGTAVEIPPMGRLEQPSSTTVSGRAPERRSAARSAQTVKAGRRIRDEARMSDSPVGKIRDPWRARVIRERARVIRERATA